MTQANVSSLICLFSRAARSDRLRLIRLSHRWSFVNAEVANAISLVLWTIISYKVNGEFTFRFDGAYGGWIARFTFIFGLKLIASIAVNTLSRDIVRTHIIAVQVS